MSFNESSNVSCNIWHCKNYSQNAGGKLRTANVFFKYTQNMSVKYILGNKDVFGSKTYFR